jgi:hypothetical protein
MSQTKAQLVGGVGISTVGNLSVYGGVNVTGVLTATSFSGDGSSLSGISSVSLATTSFGLTGTPNITVGVATATSFVGPLTGNSTGLTGTPNINVGVATATSFVGPLTGNSTGLTGTPNITVGIVTASSAVISGNVSIAGTLTYEDVTNVDSIGIVTARSGVRVTDGTVVVGSAVTLSSGGINVVGVVTATSFRGDGSQLTGVGGAAAVTVLTSNTTLTKGTAYMLNASGLVLTLPASPSTGDAVDILNNVSGIHTLARNGSTIMSISEDMEFGEQGLKFKVWYTGSTWSLF